MVRILVAVCLSVLSYSFAASVASAQPSDPSGEAAEAPTPDPLEWFNQPMFEFNLKLDEYVLRPVATAYDFLLPDAAQRGMGRFFRNLGVVERFANNLFQGKLPQAGQEVGRFVVNTTLGGAGLLEVADPLFGWKESSEDFGQTLAVYGVDSGAYLVLPFFGPSTVRDTVGFAVDSAMNPMNYFLSTLEVFAIRGGTAVGSAINYRSLNLQLFEDVDRYSVDLYGAVQDGYLQRREKQIEE